MRSMLKAARKALGTFTEEPAEAPAPLNPRFFIVSEEMKRDPSDIEGNFAAAVKENTAMTEPETGITDQFRAGLEKHRLQIVSEIADLRQMQQGADAEHAAQLAQLDDTRRAHENSHREFTEGTDKRIADAERTLAGIDAAQRATAPIPPDVMTNNGTFYNVASRQPMGKEFYNAWRDRFAEFPTDPTLGVVPVAPPAPPALPAEPGAAPAQRAEGCQPGC